jgi:hypothetical protein
LDQKIRKTVKETQENKKKETIKIKVEIKKIENSGTSKRSVGSLKKTNKINKPLSK